MCPPNVVSDVDTEGVPEDMLYIRPPTKRKGYSFRMKTPPLLIGTTDPKSGRPFGKEIVRGLGTRHLPTARKARDRILGEVRVLEDKAQIMGDQYGRWSTNVALAVHEQINRENAEGFDEDDFSLDTASIISDMVETEERKPASKRSGSIAQIKTFKGTALRGDLPLNEAMARYIEARSLGNVGGAKPLERSTVNNLKTAVRYFSEHMGGAVGIESIKSANVLSFREEYLPLQTSGRAPDGIEVKTISKHITLLKGIWKWAVSIGLLKDGAEDIWRDRSLLPKAKRPKPKTRPFSANEVSALFRSAPTGTHKGDTIRLLLVTGCRAEEVASLVVADVDDGCTAINIPKGKNENAVRFVPLIEEASALLSRRMVGKRSNDAVFPEWPIRPSTGRHDALPQWFTRYRRQVLGDASDGETKLHGLRHTWRTIARQARVLEADINDLGGWEGERTSNRTYDHGLLREQLTETQNTIGGRMRAEGYLDAF